MSKNKQSKLKSENEVAGNGGNKIEKKVRTVVLDLETQPTEAFVWGLFDQNVSLSQIKRPGSIISWAAKWLEDDYTYFSSINMTDRKSMLQEMWKILDEADEVVGWNCVEITTPVLKMDSTWVPVGDLIPGDKIVGFEEGIPPGSPYRINGKWVENGNKSSRARQIIPCEVTHNSIKDAECVEVLLSNGDKIITTLDHAWLSQGPKDNSQLKPGYRVIKLVTPWEKDKTYEAGWLSGFLDGEGTFFQKGKQFKLSFCQAVGPVWDRAIQYLKDKDIKWNSFTQKQKSTGKTINSNKVINYGSLAGSKWDILSVP